MPGIVLNNMKEGSFRSGDLERRKALNLLKLNSTDIVAQSLEYIEHHFNNEDKDKRREAHALVHKILDKMVPSKIEHETTKSGEIDSTLAKVLLQFAKSKGVDLEDISDAVEVTDGDS